MKKYIPLAGLLLALFSFVPNKNIHANVAAGEIRVVPTDVNFCDGLDTVRLVLTYVNECVSSPPPPMQVSLNLDPLTNCGSSQTVLAFRDNSKTLNGRQYYIEDYEVPDDPCVARSRECKLGMQYYVSDPIKNLPQCRWNISWSSTLPRATTGLNLVYDGDPEFYISNIYDNSIPCTDTQAPPDGSPPNKPCVIEHKNIPAEFINPVPVERFCVGKQYHYAFNAVDEDGDKLRYEMVNPQAPPGLNITMIPGFFPDEPFPSTTPIEFDPVNGVLSFTPNVDYEATVAVQVQEYRDSCWINSEGAWNSKEVLISSTTREMRFVFGSFCSSDVVGMKNYEPDPNDPTPTPEEVIVDTLEYDCATMYLDIKLTFPILCSSIETLASDFRLVLGDVYNPDSLVAIDSAYSIRAGGIDWQAPRIAPSVNPYEPYCGKDNLTENIIIKLNEPLAPDTYNLFLKTGDDFNTLTTMCGLEMDEYTTYTVIINNKADKLKFEMEDIFACRPQDPAPVAVVHPIYGPSPKDEYSWRFKGQKVTDSLAGVLGGEYNDRRKLVVDSTGTYTVTFKRVGCSYTEDFDVTIYRDMKLPEIPDYHLCLTDPFPVIDTMRKHLDKLEAEGKTVTNPQWWLYSTKNPEGEIVSYFDTLETVLPGRYVFQATVDLCVLEEEFFITRQTVLDVDIGPDVLTLCEGDTAFLESEFDFKAKSPDYLYQWSMNGEIQEGETSRAYPPITESGQYSLKVYKPSGCFGTDTINIEIVDTLESPQPECISISYYEGQVFAWEPIDHAESYQVKEIYADRESAWIDAVPDEQVASSHTSTYDVKYLSVRAVNEEVDETYYCKYSPVTTTRQCDIIISSPNIFTPNGDGKNDVLMFNLLEIFEGSSLQVFNRWGNLVYESNDYQNDWDGEDLPGGTYFYILDINDDRHEIQKGTFTLIK